jgi:hypothetical protein
MTDNAEFSPDDIQALLEWLRGDIRKRSPRELQARRTLARMLRSERPLDLGLRFILADAVDPDGEGGKQLLLKRKPGRPRRIIQQHVAAFVYQRHTVEGVLWESAVSEAMEKFSCKRGTVTGAWRNWQKHIERQPQLFLRALART